VAFDEKVSHQVSFSHSLLFSNYKAGLDKALAIQFNINTNRVNIKQQFDDFY